MNNLKFRAWLKNSSPPCMIYDRQMWVLEFSNLRECIDYWTQESDFMMFSGLHDKDKKDIYDGDIVMWLGDILPISVQPTHGMRFMMGKDTLSKGMAERSKVIGNIYEHPNLLKTPIELIKQTLKQP